MKLILTGASGFVGKNLIEALKKENHELITLGRAPTPFCKNVEWDPLSMPHKLDPSVFVGADAVIHLMGYPVANRWTPEVKKKIRDSRVLGTRELVAAIKAVSTPERPRTLISASAVGYYGDRGDEVLNEGSTEGSGFLTDVVEGWEAEAHSAESLGLRTVLMRLGLILGRGGGALEKMQPVVLGRGKHWMSWVHVNDVVSFILWALKYEEVKGVYNIVAPESVTNKEFTKKLATAKNWAITPYMPAPVLKLALGEMSSMLFCSQHIEPKRTLESGFVFRYPDLNRALKEIYG